MVSRIGPKRFISKVNNAIGPIRDTITSTVVATKLEKMNNASSKPYSWAKDGYMDPAYKIDEQAL